LVGDRHASGIDEEARECGRSPKRQRQLWVPQDKEPVDFTLLALNRAFRRER
jgi:hypothetical protein